MGYRESFGDRLRQAVMVFDYVEATEPTQNAVASLFLKFVKAVTSKIDSS